jgi:2-dehydropantoate 2-reductase
MILGGGGLGTVYAGYLARAGVDVTLLVKPAHAAAFESEEIHITGLVEFRTAVRVRSAPEPGDAFDYLIVCVKGRDTERALAPLRGLDVATVLSMQNGVGKDEVLARFFGRERALGAVSMVGGTLLRPGHARHSLALPTLVGELDGEVSGRALRLAEALQESGLPAAAVPDIRTREWEKLAVFLRTALGCSIVRTDIASALLDPDLIHLCVRIVKEVAAVAAAEGHSLGGAPDSLIGDPNRPDEELIAAYQHLARSMRTQGPPTFPSMAQDLIAGRPTELEETAGDVLRRAERHAIRVPSLAACVALQRAIERANP